MKTPSDTCDLSGLPFKPLAISRARYTELLAKEQENARLKAELEALRKQYVRQNGETQWEEKK